MDSKEDLRRIIYVRTITHKKNVIRDAANKINKRMSQFMVDVSYSSAKEILGKP